MDDLIALLGLVAQSNQSWGGWGSGGKGWGGGGKGWGNGGKSWGKGGKSSGKGNNDKNWISALAAFVQKKLKRSVTKEDIQYDFIEEEVEGKKKFQATVTSAEFEKTVTYTGKAANSKSEAKQDAAKTAIKAEFSGASKTQSKKEEKISEKKRLAKEATAASEAAKKETREKLQAFDASLKVYVGGLTEKVTVAQLKTHFAGAGEVQMVERMGAAAAIVVYSSEAEAENAISTLTGKALAGCTPIVDKWVAAEKTKKTKKEKKEKKRKSA